MASTPGTSSTRLQRVLGAVERVGNRLPNPATLFALLATAVGTVAPRPNDPATFDVYVTGADLAAWAAVDGAGVAKQPAGTAAGQPARSVRLPVRGKGTFRVEYAGRRLRVFRGSGGLAVQVRPGVL